MADQDSAIGKRVSAVVRQWGVSLDDEVLLCIIEDILAQLPAIKGVPALQQVIGEVGHAKFVKSNSK